MGFLEGHTDKIYAALRIMAGAMFTLHGMQKVLGFFGGVGEGTPAFIQWGAGLIELVGGVLITIGLFTGPAAFLCSGTMAVAYFMAHAFRDGFELMPILNKGELAALYCFVFLFIAAKGSGIWSVDDARGA